MTYEQFHPNEPDEKNLRWMAAITGLFSLLGIGGMLVGQLYLKRCDRKSWLIFGGVIVGVTVLRLIGGSSGNILWGLAFVVGFIGMIVGTIKNLFGRDEWLVYGGAWAGAIIPIVAILLIGGVVVTPRDESPRTEPQRTVQNTFPPVRDESDARSRSGARSPAEKVAPQSESVSYRFELVNAITDYLDIKEVLLGDNMSHNDMRAVCVANLKVGALILKVDVNDHPDDRALSMSQMFHEVAQQVHDEMQVCMDFEVISAADLPLVNQYLQR